MIQASCSRDSINLIFLDCYTSWCAPCKKMSEEVFTQETVGKFFNNRFINIKMDMEKGLGPDIVKKYGVVAFPTFLILDSEGNEVGRVLGWKESDEFIKQVKQASDITNSSIYLKSVFMKEKSISAAGNYLKILDKSFKNKESSQFMSQYIDSLDLFEMLSADMWKYIRYGASVRGCNVIPFQRYIERNKAYLSDKVGAEIVNITLLKSYNSTICDYFLHSQKEYMPDKEDVLKAIEYTKILASGTENAKYMIAKIADLYLCGDISGVIKMYGFMAYRNLSLNNQARIEEIYLSIKQIPQEKHDYYKKIKREYMERRLPSV
ncbi:MAG: thioredoxin family protein [Bacteroidales bacterium]